MAIQNLNKVHKNTEKLKMNSNYVQKSAFLYSQPSFHLVTIVVMVNMVKSFSSRIFFNIMIHV